MDILWHYTCGIKIQSIISDGLIKQATAHIEPGEKPVVWFSSNKLWEPTASKATMRNNRLYRLTRDETEREASGLFRISVSKETAPHNWDDYVNLSGASSQMISLMKKNGYNQGSRISQWFFSFDPVPRSKWISFDQFVNGIWTSIDPDEFVKTFVILKPSP